MDARPDVIDDDEISLLDIYDFIRDGWWTLVGMTALGLLVGLVTAFVLPTQYQASALVDSGRVRAVALDASSVLVEKLKSPGFYSVPTLEACGLRDTGDDRAQLAAALGPNIPRGSSFVALSYRSSAPALARGCLEAVLQDVLDAQAAAFIVSKGVLSNERLQAERQLDKLRSDQSQLEDARRDSLVAVQEQLQQTRTALQSLDAQLVPQSSQANAVNVLMLLNLRGDVQQLESALSAIQTTLSAASFGFEAQTDRLSERLTNLSAALEAPSTQSARYVTGISAPDSPVAPRRSLIVVLGVLIGGFAGLMLLIGRRAIVHIRSHEAERRARSAS